MGGGKPRSGAPHRAAPRSPAPLPFPPFLRLPPSFLRRQEPTRSPQVSRRAHHSPNTLPPSPIHPSPLLADLRVTPKFGDAGRSPLSGRVVHHTAKFGVARRSAFRGEVRWGMGSHEPAAPIALRPRSPVPPPFPSFLRRQEPRARRRYPAAPTTHPTSSPSSPIHPSPLLGGRLGGGCDATSQPHQSRCPFSVIPAQAGTHALAAGIPRAHHSPNTLPPSPIHPSPLPGGRLGGG